MLLSVCRQMINFANAMCLRKEIKINLLCRAALGTWGLVATLQVLLQGVAELQQQVAELKLERSQLLKAVTESQHDAACLAEHVRQIGQLKQVLAAVQQENAELSKGNKVQPV